MESEVSGCMVLPSDVRKWWYYPITMPLTKEGNGPAIEGRDEIAKITWEVWSQDLTESYGPFDCLPDAINEAMRLSQHERMKENNIYGDLIWL